MAKEEDFSGTHYIVELWWKIPSKIILNFNQFLWGKPFCSFVCHPFEEYRKIGRKYPENISCMFFFLFAFICRFSFVFPFPTFFIFRIFFDLQKKSFIYEKWAFTILNNFFFMDSSFWASKKVPKKFLKKLLKWA